MEIKSIISFLFVLVSLSNAQTWMEDRHECRGGNFKNMNIRKNRDLAFNKLLTQVKNTSYHGFHHTQAGDKPDEKVTASFLCPPSVQSKPLCECCLKHLVKYIVRKCPRQNEVVAWDIYHFVQCMVRYSVSRNFLSVYDDWAWYCYEGVDRISTVELEKTLDGLTGKLKEQAAGGDALRKFASGYVSYDHDEFPLHAAVQCTPDLSKADCVKCLSKAITGIRGCSTRKAHFDGSYLSASCYVWYSHTDSLLDPPTKIDPEYCMEPR